MKSVEVQVPVISDIKGSRSIISLQVKKRNQELEKLSTNEVALNIISARTYDPN
jgi:hypothetical protein